MIHNETTCGHLQYPFVGEITTFVHLWVAWRSGLCQDCGTIDDINCLKPTRSISRCSTWSVMILRPSLSRSCGTWWVSGFHDPTVQVIQATFQCSALLCLVWKPPLRQVPGGPRSSSFQRAAIKDNSVMAFLRKKKSKRTSIQIQIQNPAFILHPLHRSVTCQSLNPVIASSNATLKCDQSCDDAWGFQRVQVPFKFVTTCTNLQLL